MHWLTEELVALGHDVTLFASGDSRTSAKLDATWPKALRLDGSVRDPNALHMVMLERVRQKCDDEEFDFLHFHLDYYPFSLFYRQPTPFLTTLHGRLDLPEHQPVFNTFSEVPVISISERAAAAGAAGQLGAHHPPRPAGKSADAAAGASRPISRCSAGSRRKRASIARSGSPPDAAFRSRSRPRSIAPTRTITTS